MSENVRIAILIVIILGLRVAIAVVVFIVVAVATRASGTCDSAIAGAATVVVVVFVPIARIGTRFRLSYQPAATCDCIPTQKFTHRRRGCVAVVATTSDQARRE